MPCGLPAEWHYSAARPCLLSCTHTARHGKRASSRRPAGRARAALPPLLRRCAHAGTPPYGSARARRSRTTETALFSCCRRVPLPRRLFERWTAALLSFSAPRLLPVGVYPPPVISLSFLCSRLPCPSVGATVSHVWSAATPGEVLKLTHRR